MRKAMLLAIIILTLLSQGCHGLPAEDIPGPDKPEEPAANGEIVREERPGPPQDEAYPPEPEAVCEEPVASITPDFLPDIGQKALQNPDTVGWLYIPDTTIDHVVVQNPPEMQSNLFYLNVGFDQMPDKNGTFCADYQNTFESGTGDGLSRITTIYGHSWSDNPDGIMFEQLKKFRDAEFARAHPYIFFSTQNQNMAWEVFAVFDTTVDLPYIIPDLNDNNLYNLLDTVYMLSEYSYNSVVSPDDKLLVLSTCTYSVRGRPLLPAYNDYRFVVMAKLADPLSPGLREAVFHVNESPAPPDKVAEYMRGWQYYTFPAVITK